MMMSSRVSRDTPRLWGALAEVAMRSSACQVPRQEYSCRYYGNWRNRLPQFHTPVKQEGERKLWPAELAAGDKNRGNGHPDCQFWELEESMGTKPSAHPISIDIPQPKA